MTTQSEVQEASRKFYAALSRMLNGEKGSMKNIWSHKNGASALQPTGANLSGWGAIEKSFDEVAGICSGGKVKLDDQHIQTSDGMAFEYGKEMVSVTMAGKRAEVEQRVTNVYRKEPDGWKIVHHHVDKTPAIVEIVEGMKMHPAS